MSKNNQSAVIVKNLHKTFRLPHEQASGIKQLIVNFTSHKKGYEQQKVLNDVSFEIKKGEFFGIVGRNGSGKSTLLKLLAGIYAPDKGLVQVNGSLTPFIELGVGFNPELTGRENIFLNGALLGFNRSEMNEMYDDIVDFAELEKFLDQKLKNYSSGMQVRLAFSIAIRAQSDILLLDEVLAVGDADFQRKCYDYFMSLKKRKQTVILVTHDMNAVRQYCDRAIMIESGEIVKQGTPEEIAQEYQKLFAANNEDEVQSSEDEDVWGEGGIIIEKTKVLLTNDFLHVTTTYKATKDLPAPVYGFTLHNKAGTNVLEANTIKEKIKTAPVSQSERIIVEWKIPNILSDGSYNLSVACCDQSVTHFYTWQNNAAIFKVDKYQNTAGVVSPEIKTVIKEKK